MSRVSDINKDLENVIAEGCCAVWGAADLECYAKDEETAIMRLMDQYYIEPATAKGIAKIICSVGKIRAKQQRDLFELECKRNRGGK